MKEGPKGEPQVVQVGWLLQRLQLERRLLVAVIKLGLFLIYFVCLTNALSKVQPADEIGRAQRHLQTHFGLGAASSVDNFSQLYTFIEAFEAKAAVLQQESAQYWCERSYFHRVWSHTFKVPLASCTHRTSKVELDSVVAAGGHSKTFDRLRKFTGPQIGLAPAIAWQTRWKPKACKGFASTYNRLASSPLVGNTTVYFMHGGKLDGGTTLAVQTMTFEEAKARCIALKGCAGFTFEGTRKSSPVAVTFKGAPMNSSSSSLWSSVKREFVVKSAIGERSEDALLCADRSTSSNSQYAIQIPCATGICSSSATSFSKRQTFRDADIYPKLLWRPGKDATMLRQLGWLDGLTKSVTMAGMAYTDEVGVFTLATVQFNVNSAGGLESEVRMFSYKANDSVDKGIFMACMIIAFVFGLLALAWCVLTLAKEPQARRCKVHLFEFVMELFLVSFIVVVFVMWMTQDSKESTFFKLLRSFATGGAMDADKQDKVAEQFLNAASQIIDRATICFNIRIAGFVLLHLMLIQVVLYFFAHPRMRGVIGTLAQGASDLMNFAVLLVPLFLLLGAMAQYAFGPHIDDYKTYSATLSLQVRRLFGEMLVDRGVQNRLPNQQLVLYWLYTLTMWLVIFWAFIYLLAAMVIDAFITMQDDGRAVSNSFLWDVFDCLRAPLIWRRLGWPSKANFIKALETAPAPNGLLAYRDFARLPVFGKADPKAFVSMYNSKCGCGGQLTSAGGAPTPSEAPEALPMPKAPKAPEIKMQRTEAAKELTAVEIPYLPTQTQRSIATQVQMIVERRLNESIKLGTQCNWESLSSELAVDAVSCSQQVLLKQIVHEASSEVSTRVDTADTATPKKSRKGSPSPVRDPATPPKAGLDDSMNDKKPTSPAIATLSDAGHPPGQVISDEDSTGSPGEEEV